MSAVVTRSPLPINPAGRGGKAYLDRGVTQDAVGTVSGLRPVRPVGRSVKQL